MHTLAHTHTYKNKHTQDTHAQDTHAQDTHTNKQPHTHKHFGGGGLFEFFPNFALIPVTRELARSAIVYLPRSGSGRSIDPEANSLIVPKRASTFRGAEVDVP